MSIRFRVRSRSKRSPTHVDGSAECAAAKSARRFERSAVSRRRNARPTRKRRRMRRACLVVGPTARSRSVSRHDTPIRQPRRRRGTMVSRPVTRTSCVVGRLRSTEPGCPVVSRPARARCALRASLRSARGATGHGDRASRSNAPTPFAWRVAPTADPFGPCDLCERQRGRRDIDAHTNRRWPVGVRQRRAPFGR